MTYAPASVASGGRSANGRRVPLRTRRPTPPALVSTVAAAAALACGWWYLAPPSLAGTTSLAIVDGTSMLPRFKRDDLVLIRPAGTYRVGDVVAYRSAFLHRVVLHRIVAIHAGRYTFKGDNNSWLDPEKPTSSQLIGKRWVHLPRAGSLARAVRTPAVAAALAALLAIVWGLGGSRQAKVIEKQ